MTPCDPSATSEVVLKLLQTVLGYSLALNKTRSTVPHKEGKYWQGLIDKTYSITDKVLFTNDGTQYEIPLLISTGSLY